MENSYKVENKCAICKNEEARLFVDGLIASGVSYADALERLSSDFDLHLELKTLQSHLTLHSPLVLKTAQIILEKSKNGVNVDDVDPMTSISKVINVGDKMIDNWLFNRPGPKMPVTGKMYTDALKEQGRRVEVSAMDKLFDETEKAMIERKRLKVMMGKDALPTIPGPVLES